jgi:hypothetical protein
LNYKSTPFPPCLLVIENQLPSDVLEIYLFNSQSCEGIFRSARAMSGAFSNVVNFSVFDFLQRADKLCLLQSMKTESEYASSLQSVRFPTHHKQGKSSSSSSTSSIPFSLTTSDIEEVVQRAFRDACDLIEPLNVNEMLHKNGYRTLAGLSNFIRKQLNASKLSP